MTDKPDGCVKPSKGPILPTPEMPIGSQIPKKEASMVQARVGKPAPISNSALFMGVDLRISDYQTTKGNGLLSASTPVISPLSERQNYP